jgi:[NiFe] hydrogenase assembly HybE family chaperone
MPMPTTTPTGAEGACAALAARVLALEACYQRVEAERMRGLPLCNPALLVRALGFRWAAEAGAPARPPAVAEGILITPWCMNLVRLPARAEAGDARMGRRSTQAFGVERFAFLGAQGEGVGYHETCSLFSPMGDFRSQAEAEAAAWAVLALTHPAPSTARAAPAMPARRAFLLGRGAGAEDPG